MLPDEGLEPSTSRLEVLRSIQLSQSGKKLCVSDTGTRTLAKGVKTLYPNHLDYIGWGGGAVSVFSKQILIIYELLYGNICSSNWDLNPG